MMFLTLLQSSTRCMGRLSSNVLRTPLRYPSTSSASPFRNYATSRTLPRSPPRRAPSIKSPSSMRTAGRPPIVLTENSAARKTQNAQRLFDAGDKTLYQSTKRTTFFRAFAFSLTGVAALGITYFWASGLLDMKTYRELEHNSPVAVMAAFSIVAVFLGGAAGWSLMRSWNHVHSIQLVQKSGSILLQVTARSGVPFFKRRFTIPLQNMVADSRFVAAYGLPAMLVPAAPSESSPSAFTAGVLRETMKAFSRFFYSIFDSARVFFSQEGIITVDIIQENRKGVKSTQRYFLDTSALYLLENDKVVLWDIVDTKDPYDFS